MPKVATPTAAPTQPRRRGRPKNGPNQSERATAEIDLFLRHHRCSFCEEPATTAVTPDGMPSLGRLRAGAQESDRADILFATTDFRCVAHAPRGRPTKGPGTTREVGAAATKQWLAGRACADAVCDAPAVGAITPAGTPNLGHAAQGDASQALQSILDTAVGYCDRCLSVRNAMSIRPHDYPLDPTLLALGGPVRLLDSLLAHTGHQEPAATTDPNHDLPQDLAPAAFAAMGIDFDTLHAWLRGTPTAQPLGLRRVSDRDRVERLGGAVVMVKLLRDSLSQRTLAAALESNGSGKVTTAYLEKSYRGIGVDLLGFYPPRLAYFEPMHAPAK